MHNNSKYLELRKLYFSIKKISTILARKDKVRIIISAILITLSTMLEVAAISTMYPFLAYAFDGHSNFTAIPLIDFEAILKFFNGSIITISAVYISFIIFSLFFRIFILRQTGHYIAYASNNLASQIFERTVFGDKEILSSPEVVSNIILRCNYAMGTLLAITNVFASVILMSGIAYTLMSVNAMVTIIGCISVAACYLIITSISSKKSLSNGALIDNKSVLQLKHANQCIGNFKNIVIEGRIKNEIQCFSELDIIIRLSRLSNHLITSIPRSAIEALIVSAIIISIAYASEYGIKVENMLPSIGLYAIAFQRLLPSINSLFINYINILQSAESIDKLAMQINELGFKERIEHRNCIVNTIELIEFSNKHKVTNENLYKPISYLIKKGDKIIIKGHSGVGKSTLLESIIGLNTSYTGKIKVNGIALDEESMRIWWNSLTYIPQTAYIFEGSLYYNITMLPDGEALELKKYEVACRISRLPYSNDFIEHQDIHIHEDGRNLSGGERQRLLLARALYRMKDVIFLDESLSALDSNLRRQILTDLIEKCPEIIVFYISHNTEDTKLFEKQITLDR